MNLPILSSILGVTTLSLLKAKSGSPYIVEFDEISELFQNNSFYQMLRGIKSLSIDFSSTSTTNKQYKNRLKSAIYYLRQAGKKHGSYSYTHLDKLHVKIGAYSSLDRSLIDQELLDLVMEFIQVFHYERLEFRMWAVHLDDLLIRSSFRLPLNCKELSVYNLSDKSINNMMLARDWRGRTTLSNLRKIDVSRFTGGKSSNRLTGLKFDNLKRLEEVRVDGLTEFPDMSKSVSTLKSVTLINCKNLKEIPSYISDAKLLESFSLYMSSSDLQNLPDFKKCKKLKYLQIVGSRKSNTKYRSKRVLIPGKLFDYCPLLEKVDLRYIGISEIPENIGGLRRLVILNLRGNNLETIPSNILSIPTLKELNLSDNMLQHLPKEFWVAFISKNMRFRLLNKSNPMPTLLIPSMEELVRMLDGRKLMRSGEIRIMKLKAIHPQIHTNIRRF